MHPPKKTAFPVPLALIQTILDQLGYNLVFHHPETERLHFRREKKPTLAVLEVIETANPPEWVVITKPDFVCDGVAGFVYDRDYVVDLINKINGQIGGEGGANLLVLLTEEKDPH